MAMHKIRLNLELNPGPDRVYTVTSPDIPQLITEGSTPAEIAYNVQDAINCLLEAVPEFGLEIPPALRPENGFEPTSYDILVAA
ncbi:MAG: type II toxin-antitoxin system HicB family antitoxin [Ardenticatenaceae bacterium]